MALVSLGQARHPAVRRGVEYLIATLPERGQGVWVDRWWTGTGFPKVFYLRYHLYSAYFPLLALHEVRQAWNQGS